MTDIALDQEMIALLGWFRIAGAPALLIEKAKSEYTIDRHRESWRRALKGFRDNGHYTFPDGTKYGSLEEYLAAWKRQGYV